MKRDLDVNDPVVKSAVLGQQVEDFLETDIGNYLMERAKEEENRCLDALSNVATWRHRRIRELQGRIWMARGFQNWLVEAYNEGLQSLRVIEGEDE